MIVYAVATFVAWLGFGRPNPMGPGYLSKGIEIISVTALVAYTWLAPGKRSASSAAA